MESKVILTTDSGAPITDNQNSRTAGPAGPVLIEDHRLIEKLAHFDRERIPERVVHAKGSGAYGYFEVLANVTQWTKASFLAPGHRQVVEAFAANRADEPLDVSVLPRRARRDWVIADTHCTDALGVCWPERAVAVTNQMTWRFAPRKGFGHLTCNPTPPLDCWSLRS